MERILLAVDGSEHSWRAASLAGELSICLRVPVFIPHVMGRRGLGDLGGLLMGSVSHKVGHLTDKTLVTTQ